MVIFLIALLSISPYYADSIFDGTKRYEYRRVRFTQAVSAVIVYATLPVGRVVGICDVNRTIIDTPSRLWQHTRRWSGMSRDDFWRYFADRSYGVALALAHPYRYPEPLALEELRTVSRPPQSFCYLPWLPSALGVLAPGGVSLPSKP